MPSFGPLATFRKRNNYHRANAALQKIKPHDRELETASNALFLGKLGDCWMPGWWFVRKTSSAASGHSKFRDIFQQQWTVWKSTWKIFGDTKSEGICFTIIGGSFWRWLHPGSLVEYPTVPGGMGQVPSLDKDPYSNDQNKMLRIYSTQSKGWLFWRTNTIVELSNLKLQSDRCFPLTVCLRHTPTWRDPLVTGRDGKSEKSAQKLLFVAMDQ